MYLEPSPIAARVIYYNRRSTQKKAIQSYEKWKERSMTVLFRCSDFEALLDVLSHISSYTSKASQPAYADLALAAMRLRAEPALNHSI
jgi:hypothetical protein